MRYPPTYDERGSTGRAVALLREVSPAPGVVLDLGCGSGAVAEPLRDLGLDYVGCDVDAAGLAHLAERGFETHQLSLSSSADDLTGRLRAVIGDRDLVAVLVLDVLEHLVDPVVVLRSVLALTEAAGTTPPLVISIPNVTHYDVAAKLLLGRWDVDAGGLLDDTHLRFFSEGELGRLLAAGGWEVEAAADTVAEVSDQCWPVDAPTLRPGAPLRELLRGIRTDAGPGATTYQFVRRLRRAPSGPTSAPYFEATDERRPLVAALVVGSEHDSAPLLADLDTQDPPISSVTRIGDVAGLAQVMAELDARLLTVFDARSRVAPGWVAAVAGGVEHSPGRVLQVPSVVVDDERWAGLTSTDDWSSVLGDGAAADIEGFDPLHVAPPRPAVAGAFVVPLELVAAAGVRPRPELGAYGLTAWLAQCIQLSGSVPIGGDPLVAIAQEAVYDPVSTEAIVVEALDRRPLVLPAGSAGRLAMTRRRVIEAEGAVLHLQHLVAVEQEKVAGLDFHLRHFGAELDGLRPELERLRLEHARRPSRRLAALLRRLFG